MILKCLEGIYVTYTSKIFPDPCRKKQVFIKRYLGHSLQCRGIFGGRALKSSCHLGRGRARKSDPKGEDDQLRNEGQPRSNTGTRFIIQCASMKNACTAGYLGTRLSSLYIYTLYTQSTTPEQGLLKHWNK